MGMEHFMHQHQRQEMRVGIISTKMTMKKMSQIVPQWRKKKSPSTKQPVCMDTWMPSNRARPFYLTAHLERLVCGLEESNISLAKQRRMKKQEIIRCHGFLLQLPKRVFTLQLLVELRKTRSLRAFTMRKRVKLPEIAKNRSWTMPNI